MAGLFASLFAELGRAVSDVRHRVVEEGWFGKQVTDVAGDKLGWDIPQTPFDEQWAQVERKDPQAPSPEIDTPDFDR